MVRRKSPKKHIFAKRQAMHQKIATERIEILFSEAKKAFSENPERSKIYALIARRIGMKCNVSIPKKHRMMLCRNCGEYLVCGFTSSVRLDSAKGNIVISCRSCGKIKRHPYKKQKTKI